MIGSSKARAALLFFCAPALFATAVSAQPADATAVAPVETADGAKADDSAGEEAASPAEPAQDPLIEEGDALWEAYDARSHQIKALKRQARSNKGEELLVLEEKIWSKTLAQIVVTRELAYNLVAQEKKQIDTEATRTRIHEIFERSAKGFGEHFSWRDRRVDRLREARAAAEGQKRVDAEKQLTAEQDRYQVALGELSHTIEAMETMELDTSAQTTLLAEHLVARAEDLSGRLDFDWKSRAGLRERLENDPDSAELQTELQAVEESFDRRERNLSSTISLMGPLDLETAPFELVLIETTGELSTGIFDRDVALGLVRSGWRQASGRLRERGPVWTMRALLFVSTLVLFSVLAAITRRVVSRVVRTSKSITLLLRDTLVTGSSRVVLIIGLLVALSQIGVQIGPLLAGLGIAGFIVGFALQDSLANFAAGGMILLYRPYDVGDVIEAGTVRGVVGSMNLVSTTILTFDNETLIVPNNKIWGDVIRNETAQSARRIDLIFKVGHQEDVDRITSILLDVISSHEKVLEDPEPAVRLHLIGDSAIEFAVRPWVRREDYWPVYWDLTLAVKVRFGREGIAHPRPRLEVVVTDRP